MPNATPETRLPIHLAIQCVMKDLEAVDKNRKNESQGYRFRGIDDVYNALHSILAKHGVFTIPRVVSERTEDRTTGNGKALIYRILSVEFDFYGPAGDFIKAGPFIGEGMDSGDKASNKAMSVAHKYALIQVFAIPTEDDKDPEGDSHDLHPAPTEADCLRADIYAAGAKLDKATQNKIEAAIQKAGDDLAKLQSILAHTHKTATEKDTQP